MKGLGIHNIITLGILMESIELEIKSFLDSYIDKIVILKSLKEELLLTEIEQKVKRKENIKISIDSAKKRIQKINFLIKEFNEILSLLDLKNSLKELDETKICNIFENRLEKDFFEEDSIVLANEHLFLALSSEFKTVMDSIKELMDYFKRFQVFEGIENLEKLYYKQIKEAINIFSIGYGQTAVLCAGRILEGMINDYLKKLLEKKDISLENFNEFINNKYNNKLGFLKDKVFLSEEEFIKLKAFTFDRDKGGHPHLGDINQEKAKILISSAIWLIIDFQIKFKKLVKND